MEEPLTGVFDIKKAGGGNGNKNKTKEDVTKANIPLVDAARRRSIQARATDSQNTGLSGTFREFQLLFTNDIIPAWWSTRRDKALSEFWKSVNLLSGAMYTMTSKMTTIPFHIEPRDLAITSHFAEADRFERRLKESAEFGKGWIEFFSKQVQSLLGQDNGRFMEILSVSGSKDGPLIGPALSVAHLDPSKCQRTGNTTYPVLYRRSDDGLRKIHWTRVAFNAQLPSERVEMRGVGMCGVGRATSYAQNMLDISTFKEEKLGSRPKRGMILVGGGLDAESVGGALEVADNISTSKGLKRFSFLPIVGSPDIETPTMEMIEMSSLPDGFNEQEATDIAMAAIALAFGVDARELWPNAQRGATRADALLSHIKQRGKGPGQILAQTEHMFDYWFLPPYLRMVFDFQDDAQDRQRAEIRRERSLTRKQDLASGITDDRTERERMVKEGEISTAQFAQLELSNGRLPNGKPLQTLFFVDEAIYNEVLAIPNLSNPLDILSNDPEKALEAISKQVPIAYEIIARETRQIQMTRAQEALATLEDLRLQYEKMLVINLEEEALEAESGQNRQGVREGAQSNDEDESAINVVQNDEANLSAENSPRDFKKDGDGNSIDFKKGDSDMGIFKRKNKKGTLRKAIDSLQDAVQDFEAPIVVNVTTPEINIPPAEITVNVPKQETPVINLPEVQVNIPDIDLGEINVNIPEMDMPEIKVIEKKSDKEEIKFKRNEMGEIIGVVRESVE